MKLSDEEWGLIIEDLECREFATSRRKAPVRIEKLKALIEKISKIRKRGKKKGKVGDFATIEMGGGKITGRVLRFY
tara:strand:- start:474 stop:701 length:228 start_codon:yes stop_codon:yes gene_type:complete